jgi:hypothetical protein
MMHVNCKNDELYFENQKQFQNIEKNRKNKKNAVRRANLLSINEIQISEIIRTIPRFFMNFGPVLQYRDFKLAEIDNERFEKCRVMNATSSEYFLFQYENREKMRDFWSFFDKSAKKKQKIHKIIQSFKNLLQIMEKMSERKLAHMNLVPRSILFKEDETPYLINFDQTLLFENDPNERKSNEEMGRKFHF